MSNAEEMWLEKYDRAKFLDSQGEPNTIGIVVDVEVIEGQRSYQVLEESRQDGIEHPWQKDNPFGTVHYWDFQSWEKLGKVSVEEMLISENEMIREFAKKYMEDIENNTNLSDSEIQSYQKKEATRKRIVEADDDELSKIIDCL